MVLGEILGAFACGDNGESSGAAPVDHLADQGRLVAVRERIHHTRFKRAAREKRPRERVGFDVDHHHVLALRKRRQRVADAEAEHQDRERDVSTRRLVGQRAAVP